MTPEQMMALLNFMKLHFISTGDHRTRLGQETYHNMLDQFGLMDIEGVIVEKPAATERR